MAWNSFPDRRLFHSCPNFNLSVGGILADGTSATLQHLRLRLHSCQCLACLLEVLIYYWDERDGPNFHGWWFGPKVSPARIGRLETAH